MLKCRHVRENKLAVIEFAGIHDKLHKQGLFNLNLNWPHFQKRSSLGSLAVGDARVWIGWVKRKEKHVCTHVMVE